MSALPTDDVIAGVLPAMPEPLLTAQRGVARQAGLALPVASADPITGRTGGWPDQSA
jgi:hypothetical protein